MEKIHPDYKGRYPKMVVFHGLQDHIVSVENAHSILKQWAWVTCSDSLPRNTEKNFAGLSNVTRYSYFDKNGDEKMVFYEINHLGHALPIDPGIREKQGGHSGLFTANIHFFGMYWAAKEFGICK